MQQKLSLFSISLHMSWELRLIQLGKSSNWAAEEGQDAVPAPTVWETPRGHSAALTQWKGVARPGLLAGSVSEGYK
jgi:hypothetical protein